MSKSILITGSNAGIGRLSAKLFADQGWKVAATMRSPEKAGDLAEHPNITVYPLDVSQADSVAQAVEAVLSDLGQLDVVVNNAGFGVYGAFELATEEQIDRQYDVNVRGVIRVMQAFLPHFRSRKEGMFINISSIAGLLSYPLGSLYNSTKWAVEGLTEGVYFELKPFNIRVKLVEPGGFKTNFQQVGLVWTDSDTIKDYAEMTQILREKRAAAQPNLPDAIAVAEKIWEAANDPSERLRYLVGKDAEAMFARRQEIGAQAFMEELNDRLK